MERVMGLEPTISAWKANVLPLHYTRMAPARLRKLHPAKKFGAGEESRTHTPVGTGT